MIVIFGTMQFRARDFSLAIEAARLVSQHSRQEPGCLAYHFCKDISQPETLAFYEEWKDQQSLDAHKSLPHYTAFKQSLMELEPTSREVRKYQAEAAS